MSEKRTLWTSGMPTPGNYEGALGIAEAAKALEWNALDYAEGADAIVSRESWMRLRRALAAFEKQPS